MYLQFQCPPELFQPLYIQTTPPYDGVEVEMMEVQTSPVPAMNNTAEQHQTNMRLAHPALIGIAQSSIESNKAMNAGFSQCTEEAVRYLIEEEGLKEDDPFIIDLVNHLKDQQRLMNLQNMLSQCVLFSPSSESKDFSPVEETDKNNDINFKDSNCQKQTGTDFETLQTISSLATEILSLLDEDESLLDFEDEDFIVEQ